MDDQQYNEGMWKGWLFFAEDTPADEFEPFCRPLLDRIFRDMSKNPVLMISDVVEGGTVLASQPGDELAGDNSSISLGPIRNKLSDNRERS